MNAILSIVMPLIGGIGIGTIFSEWLRTNRELKTLLFKSKLIKYSNLIEAYQECVADPSIQAKQNVVSCQKQIELIATDEIISLSNKLFTHPNTVETRDKLINIMRLDLKKYT